MEKQKKDWSIFLSSVFFVLGFTIIFSLLGILLQTVLLTISYEVQQWVARIGGAIIIMFGLYLLNILNFTFLEREHKLKVKKKFTSRYIASFIFGAAFAVGWTPCVGAILGAILTLAVTNPGSGFILLFSYALGIGIPFLLVGLFTNQAQKIIRKSGRVMTIIRIIFGILLIILGILILINKMGAISDFTYATNLVIAADEGLAGFGSVNIIIAFLAGIVSFLSPCILPLIPAYLSYLATMGVKK
jgi:cytochrome c-type biogenesis protein